MRIGIFNLEPKFKNLALEKCKIYHVNKGDDVSDYFVGKQFDILYCSSIFSATDKNGLIPPNSLVGGTGFNLLTQLPLEIDAIKPHMNFGFTTRGCIRNCEFCVVPTKEGNIRVEGDLLDLWDKKSKDITLFDNNILAIQDHFEYICKQSIEYKLRLDFNQGLDHRLLNENILELMKSISHIEYRFAFDHPSYVDSVENAISLLKKYNINRCNWYVLIGFNTTFQQDLFRLNYLREQNQNAYIQRFKGKIPDKYKNIIRSNSIEQIMLARWANQHHIFQGMSWEQFIEHPDNIHYRNQLKVPRDMVQASIL